MLNILIKLFIKDNKNVKDSKVREQYGILCGGYGIFLNILLFVGKYLAGVLSGSIAMTADAFNNLSDAGSSLISVIGFKLSGKKPDPGHPFGHGRIEYLSGLLVSAIIVVMGYEITKDSIIQIIHPEETVFSLVAMIILICSILVKFYMSFYCRRIGKMIDSQTLLATSTDSLSDTISTFVVLACTLLYRFFDIKLDGVCGAVVGIFIIIAGINAARSTIKPLLGTNPSEEFIKDVEELVLSYDDIIGIHDLIVHDYGPGRLMITLHAEVPSDGNINELHDTIDQAEVRLQKELNCHATIHMDPVSVGDPFVDDLKAKVSNMVKNMDGMIGLHDFRVVRGNTHTNLIFDVVASYSLKKTDEEIADDIKNGVKEISENYFAVVSVDRDYTGK